MSSAKQSFVAGRAARCEASSREAASRPLPKLPLLHFSAEPLIDVADAEQLPQHREYMKPDGLWFSVGDAEDGWRAFCAGENFNQDRFRFCTEIVLDQNAKILTLAGADDIDRFTAEYSIPLHPELSMLYIDWRRVSESFDGLIIAPYCWSRRLHLDTSWYYGWDCASGCVWRARAVEKLRPVAIGASA